MTSQETGVPATALRILAKAFPAEWREPPLGYEGVQAWEAAHGVVLPEPYRTFVAEISDGSPLGPPQDGGLLPLAWLPDDWPDQQQRDPAAEFPLVDGWLWEEDLRVYDEVRPLVDAVYRRGSIVLGSSSGPLYWLLVVSGPQRGRVWMLSDVGAWPFPGPTAAEAKAEAEVEDEDEGASFLEWVERWHGDPDAWDLDRA